MWSTIPTPWRPPISAARSISSTRPSRSPSSATGSPRSNSISIVCGLVGRLLRRRDDLEHVVARRLGQVLDRPALGRAAPDVVVDRVRRHLGAALDRDAVLARVGDLLLAPHLPAAHRRDDLHLRVERRDGRLDPDLVVALAGAAVRDRVAAGLARLLDGELRDQRPAERREERIAAAVERVRLDRRQHVVARELLLRVDDQAVERAEPQRLVAHDVEVLAGLAEVDRQRDDLGLVLRPGSTSASPRCRARPSRAAARGRPRRVAPRTRRSAAAGTRLAVAHSASSRNVEHAVDVGLVDRRAAAGSAASPGRSRSARCAPRAPRSRRRRAPRARAGRRRPSGRARARRSACRRRAAPRGPTRRRSPSTRTRASSASSSITSSVASAAAATSGPPPNVEPWSPGSSTSAASPRGDAGADRQAARERLGDREHVRAHRRLLERPQRAGAAHPALDLVEDQQRAGCGRRPRAPRAASRRRSARRRSRPGSARASRRRCARRPRPRARSGSSRGTATKPGTSGANGSCLVSCGVADSAPIVRPWKAPSSTTISPPRRRLRASLIAASFASAPELQRNTRAPGSKLCGEPLGEPRAGLGVDRGSRRAAAAPPARGSPRRRAGGSGRRCRPRCRPGSRGTASPVGVVERGALAAHELDRQPRVGLHHVRASSSRSSSAATSTPLIAHRAHLRADAGVGEQLEQQRVRLAAVDDVRGADAAPRPRRRTPRAWAACRRRPSRRRCARRICVDVGLRDQRRRDRRGPRASPRRRSGRSPCRRRARRRPRRPPRRR